MKKLWGEQNRSHKTEKFRLFLMQNNGYADSLDQEYPYE